MRAALFVAAFSLCAATASFTAHAADPKEAKGKAAAGKEVTVSGDMTCGKCSLKETAGCQNVLKATEGGKEVKYYLAKNKVSDDNHSRVCSGTSKATVKGTVAEEGGKKVLTASEIKYQ